MRPAAKILAIRAVASVLRVVAPIGDVLRTPGIRRAGLRRPVTRKAFMGGLPMGEVLEIGPFDCPVATGPNVRYFDVLGQAALRERAASLGRKPERVPAIDFQSPDGDLSVVPGGFAAVVSAHAIEHQPDLIAHLRQIDRLLERGGRYMVIAPDRRFSFDQTLEPTSYDDVLEAQGRKVHTPEAVLAHRLRTTHNVPTLHWLGRHGRPDDSPERRADAEREAAQAAAGRYIDVHAWIFSPAEFLRIVNRLHDDGLTTLRAEAVHDTPVSRSEFCAVLTKAD